MHTYRIFLKLQKYFKNQSWQFTCNCYKIFYEIYKNTKALCKKKKYRMKDGGKKGKREGWSHPQSWEVPDALHRTVLSTLIIESKRRICTLSVSSAHIHTCKPTWKLAKVNYLTSQWSQDIWTIECNSPFLEDSLTISQITATSSGQCIWRMPLAKSAYRWLSHWTEGSLRRWQPES